MDEMLLEILGSKRPIIQGPMRFITLGEMAAVVSSHGGFGQIAASGLSPEALREEIRKAKNFTARPFGVNFPIYRPKTEELLDIAIEEGVKIITTSAGNPKKYMNKIKDAGLKVIHKVSTVGMAKKAEDAGVDGVVATGIEAGGHVGRDGTTSLCLIPQIVKDVKIPVIAAGGISDAAQLKAIMELGAQGAEVGTRFLATKECPVPQFFKRMILEADDSSTVLIGKGGMPMRVLNNNAAQRIMSLDKKNEDKNIINTKVDKLYIASKGDEQSSILPCGQVAGSIKELMTVEQVIMEFGKAFLRGI